MTPPTLLTMSPLTVEIAEPPALAAIEMVPAFMTLTVLPEMVPKEFAPLEILPKFLTVRSGVCDPEMAPPSPLMTPEALLTKVSVLALTATPPDFGAEIVPKFVTVAPLALMAKASPVIVPGALLVTVTVLVLLPAKLTPWPPPPAMPLIRPEFTTTPTPIP